jgi:hypothetical protein
LLTAALLLCRWISRFCWRCPVVDHLAPSARTNDIVSVGFGSILRLGIVFADLLRPARAQHRARELAPGVSMGQLASQGLKYFSATFHFDPLTPILLGAALIALVLAGRIAGRILAAGVVLHLLYIVSVGGDFMTGRFLTPAFVMTVAGVLATVNWSGFGSWRRILAAAILAGGLLNPAGPLRTGTDFGVVAPGPADFDRYGVTDERRVYYPDLGLYRAWLGAGSPERHGQASYAKAVAWRSVPRCR